MAKKYSGLLCDVCHSQLSRPLKRQVSLHLASIGYFSIRYWKMIFKTNPICWDHHLIAKIDWFSDWCEVLRCHDFIKWTEIERRESLDLWDSLLFVASLFCLDQRQQQKVVSLGVSRAKIYSSQLETLIKPATSFLRNENPYHWCQPKMVACSIFLFPLYEGYKWDLTRNLLLIDEASCTTRPLVCSIFFRLFQLCNTFVSWAGKFRITCVVLNLLGY